MIEKFIRENAEKASDQVVYDDKYNGMVAKYKAMKSEVSSTIIQINDVNAKKCSVDEMVTRISEQKNLITSFDEELWLSLVDSVVIQPDGEIQFNFQGKVF